MTERFEVRPRRRHLAVAALAALAFVALGLTLIAFGGGLPERAVGVVSVVFFGGLAGPALWMAARRRATLVLLPAGLELQAPGIRPRLVPWQDIEAIGVVEVAGQQFTTVRLLRYDAVIASLTDAEARKLMRRFGALRTVGRAAIFVGAANLEDPGDLVRELSGSQGVTTFADALALQRRKHGADLMFGWAERDRPAREFAELLDSYRRRSVAHAQE